MSHRIESILQLARKYQISTWQYQSLDILNPYYLASMGYQPLQRGVVQCSICLKEVKINEQALQQPQKLLEQLKQHQQNCIYQSQQPIFLKKQDLYLAIDDISNDLNQGSTNNQYPFLNTEAIWSYTAPNNYLLKKVMNLYQINREKINISFFLRLFGWTFNKSGEKTCIECYFCGKSVLLQNYKHSQQVLQNSEQSHLISEKQLFNPIQEHRYFCLWTNAEQNWTVYLQDLQEKYAEYVSFQLRVQPLSVKKMKFHIDKYLETFKQKIQASVLKLKQVSDEFGKLCDDLTKEKEAQLSEDVIEGGRKRIRNIEKEIQESSGQLIKDLTHPLKRFKQN